MVYDGSNIALTFDGTGAQTHRYLYGPGVDQIVADETPTSVNWALVDNQGSVRDVIDSNGQVLNHIVSDSYGQVTSETNANVNFRYGYTGRERDKETGLQYSRARYYDSRTGAFIGQDPIGFAAGDANLYRYVGNSPTNFSDPSGLLTLYKGNLLGDFLRAGALSPFAGAVGQIPGVSAFDVDIKVNAGEKFAEDAQRYYANRYIDESKPWYDRAGSFAGGLLASLWTCENSDKTATVLKSALEADQALKAIRTIGPKCFVEDTLVLTNSGKKPIETLRPGDWIVSWDEETGQVVEGSVTEWYEREAAAIIDIFIGVQKISCTTDHPFWVEGRGWVLAFQLKEGMALQNREGERLVIDVVRRRDEVTQVFNVEIDGLHTYFVSDLEILSHNMCGDFTPPEITRNRHGQLTNGDYTLDSSGMIKHQTGSLSEGKSQFLSGVDADKAVLDAAAYADQNGLWQGSKAKVPVSNGPVGVHGGTGELTSTINVYRNRNGFIHGAPGSPQ